jgi:hypothetical protein
MIIQERVTINDKNYTRTTSSEGRYVSRGGANFTEAIDPQASERTYIETDLIPFEAVDDDYINALRGLGVDI